MPRCSMTFRRALGAVTAIVFLVGPLVAEDDLPSWDSREAKLPPWKPATPGSPPPVSTETTTPAPKPEDAGSKAKAPEASKPVEKKTEKPVAANDKLAEKTEKPAKPVAKATEKKAPAKPAAAPEKAAAPVVAKAVPAEPTTNITNVQAPASSSSSRALAANSKLSSTKRSKGLVRSAPWDEDSSDGTPAPKDLPDLAAKKEKEPRKSIAEGTPSGNSSSSRPLRYVVKSGDTLWDLSRRFKMSVDQIKLANGLKTDRLDPGQVLMIPVHTSSSTPGDVPGLPPAPVAPGAAAKVEKPAEVAVAAAPEAANVTTAPEAESSTAPPPPSGPTISVNPPGAGHMDAQDDPARPAKRLITRAEPGDDEGPQIRAQSPLVVSIEREKEKDAPATASASTASTRETTTIGLPRAVPPLPSPEKNSVLHYTNKTLPKPVPTGMESVLTPAQKRLVEEARGIARRDIGYNRSWNPPGEKEAWRMDCSNTARYLYKRATGLNIERTASSQYYVLRQQSRCWNVPLDRHGNPDLNYLARNLRVGDLLFWENTYKPVRNPPITHVTVYLGADKDGRWLMFGSQSGAQKGLISDDHGGPDLYIFDPISPSGGYRTMLGFHEVKGRFVAHARPLPDSSLTLAQAR